MPLSKADIAGAARWVVLLFATVAIFGEGHCVAAESSPSAAQESNILSGATLAPGWALSAAKDSTFDLKPGGIEIHLAATTPDGNPWPAVYLNSKGEDFSSASQLRIEVTNQGSKSSSLAIRLRGKKDLAAAFALAAGETKEVSLPLTDIDQFDPSLFRQIGFYMRKPTEDQTFLISRIRAVHNPDYIPVRDSLLRQAEETKKEGAPFLTDGAESEEKKQLKLALSRLDHFLSEPLSHGYANDAWDEINAADRLVNKLALMRLGKPWVVWKASIGRMFEPGMMPPIGTAEATNLRALVCGNQYEPIALNISNASPTKHFSVELKGAPETPASLASLRPIEFSIARDGRRVGDAVGLAGNPITLSVPQGESAQFWIWIDTRKAEIAPGEYHYTVSISETEGLNRPQTIPLIVRVSPVRLPDDVPLMLFNWAYFYQSRVKVTVGIETAAVANLRDYGFNTWVIPPEQLPRPKADPQGNYGGLDNVAEFEKTLNLLKGNSKENFILWLEASRPGADGLFLGLEPFSDKWKEALKSYLADLRKLLVDQGLDPTRCYLMIFDEPAPDRMALALQWMRAAREVGSDFKFISNGSTLLPDAKDRAEFLQLNDCWVPNWDAISSTAADQLDGARAQGSHVVGVYRCLMCRNNRGVDINDYYRLMAWRAMETGMGVFGLWSYNAGHGEDPWNGKTGSSSGGILVYRKGSDLLTSRRWELVREGLDDYKLAQLLAGDTAALDARTCDPLRPLVQKLISDRQNPEAVDEIRKTLIEEVEKKTKTAK